jgi:hypothetical protein
MKIKSVIKKTVVVVNGKEIVLLQSDWTQSVKDAKEAGMKFNDTQKVVDWVIEEAM